MFTPRGVTALNEVKRLRTLLANHSRANISLLAQAKFEELDNDRNGFLKSSELEQVTDWVLSVYRPVDLNITDAEKARIRATMINRIDKNHDGKLDLAEFQLLFSEVTATAELMNLAETKFRELDADKSGYLETHELDSLAEWVLEAYNPIGFTASDRAEMRRKLLARIDSNKDGKLDLYEFSAIFQEVSAKNDVILKARRKFEELDDNKNGYLDSEELKSVAEWVLKAYNPQGSVLSKEELNVMEEKLLRRIDINCDGKIDVKGIYLYIYNV